MPVCTPHNNACSPTVPAAWVALRVAETAPPSHYAAASTRIWSRAAQPLWHVTCDVGIYSAQW